MGRRKLGTMPKVTVVKPSMNARVRIGGRAYWLGKSPDGKVTAEQTARAARLWNEFLSGVLEVPAAKPVADTLQPAPAEHASSGITLAELGIRYIDHCQRYYRTAEGKTTSSVDGVMMALRSLFPFAEMPAAMFGPRSMMTVRDALIREGRPRVTCNRVVKTVRRMFKWAVAEELVPADTWKALEAVAPLQKGRTDAPEVPPVDEVPEEVVQATMPQLPKIVADMVWFQRWTGARPGEVCIIRPEDIDRSKDVWVFTPPRHKLSWREAPDARHIVIGAEAQKVLLPYLLRAPSSYCFNPREAVLEHRGQNRSKGRRRPGERYTTASYRRAIARAVAAANKQREAQGIADKLPDWAPNQLRHLRAGEVKEAFGIEAAGAVLGHANIRTTEIYADRKLKIATDVARRIG